jgi:hypothetical protein
MPRANESGVAGKGGWMREDEWEISEMSFTPMDEGVADTLDRLRVCLHQSIELGNWILSP